MSQYLTINLRSKKDFNNVIELLTLCTTPARTLSDLNTFPWTDINTIISLNDLNEYIDIIKSELNDFKELYTNEEKEIINLKEYIPQIKNTDVFNKLLDNINDKKSYLKAIQNDIKEWQYYYDTFTFIKNIYLNNMTNYDLIYTNS